jgi:UDP-N-acetyl-2-amino-2-deoxyglucuronate dehydrogenase
MNFGLIGAAGYIAPRHMEAIRDTGHELKVALDPHDSVGILDQYFPECKFFTQQEPFDRHVMKHENLDYISICSPNYLHESHIKLALRLGANVICEKPLTTCPSNIAQIEKVADQMGKKIYTILQLRLHPSVQLLKKRIVKDRFYNVELEYITPRGPWYFHSWKGKEGQSGGIETNIGIHFFDMLMWLFGNYEDFAVIYRSKNMSEGKLYLKSAEVYWFLSLNRMDLKDDSMMFSRNMKVDGEEIKFDNVFSDLHTESYREILAGRGFDPKESYKSIELVSKIRESK